MVKFSSHGFALLRGIGNFLMSLKAFRNNMMGHMQPLAHEFKTPKVKGKHEHKMKQSHMSNYNELHMTDVR